MQKIPNHVVIALSAVLICLQCAYAPPLDLDQSIDAFKTELLAALNEKRKEFGFSDSFELAKVVGPAEQELIRQGSMNVVPQFCDSRPSGAQIGWLRLDLFKTSRPLYLQLVYKSKGYYENEGIEIKEDNGKTIEFTEEWKALGKKVTVKKMVDFWVSQPGPSKYEGEAVSVFRDVFGNKLLKAKSQSEGAWPFVTKTADRNVVIARADCGSRRPELAFTVLFPAYENNQVPEKDREQFAVSKTFELCVKTKQAKEALKAKLCDEMLLKADEDYKSYQKAILLYGDCVRKYLFDTFHQKGEFAKEFVAVRICDNQDLFTVKKTSGVIKKTIPNEFAAALKATNSPFGDFNNN